MLLFGIYLIVTIIILVNLLIAMMNTTIINIHNKKVDTWTFYKTFVFLSNLLKVQKFKFMRTKIWMNYFEEDNSFLPSPFNIIEALFKLDCKCCKKKPDSQEDKVE